MTEMFTQLYIDTSCLKCRDVYQLPVNVQCNPECQLLPENHNVLTKASGNQCMSYLKFQCHLLQLSNCLLVSYSWKSLQRSVHVFAKRTTVDLCSTLSHHPTFREYVMVILYIIIQHPCQEALPLHSIEGHVRAFEISAIQVVHLTMTLLFGTNIYLWRHIIVKLENMNITEERMYSHDWQIMCIVSCIKMTAYMAA